MPHYQFRFEQPVPPPRPAQPVTHSELNTLRPKLVPAEQLEPIRVAPMPRVRAEVTTETHKMSMTPKASLTPKGSVWGYKPDLGTD